jgi:uncharacterized protein YqcC (DUF446 family)
MADGRYTQLQALLDAIERELRVLDLWEGSAPDPERLASSVPFCHDTLEFHQWLQWIYVPRFQALIDAQAPLPLACDVAPLAEETFRRMAADTTRLQALLLDIDRLVQARGHDGAG